MINYSKMKNDSYSTHITAKLARYHKFITMDLLVSHQLNNNVFEYLSLYYITSFFTSIMYIIMV